MMLAPLRATLPPPAPTGDTPAAAPACAHCGLPVPPALRRASSPVFCCSGCETAYSIIHACGLDRFYDLRKHAESAPAPAPTTPRDRRYAEFDEPTFLRRYARSLPAGLMSVDLLLENVHCAACVWLVERLPALLPGVIECRLEFRRAVARVTWRPDAVPLSRIALLLSRLGYPPHPARGEAAHRARTNEERRMIARLGVAAACASSTMLFALALYAGLFSGIDHATVALFRWFSLGITLLCLLWPGLIFFRSAITSLRAGVANLDAPIALALLAGGLWSIASTLRGTGEVYFDSLSTLVFLLLMGRFIQRRQQRRAADAVELLFTLTASAARVVSDAGVREVPADALTPGDVVEVRAGESFPADGLVIQGRSAADLSLLTGESRPVEIREGSDAVAGAVNLGSTVLVSVRASGEATRAGRLMKLVEDAAHRRAPIVRTADKAAAWFLIGMTLLAALTFAIWLRAGLETALEHAIAVLVVTCPCALGLATPLAFSVAIGRAARAGAFIKGGDAIQRLASPGRIILDKTGTLTVGRLALARWTGDDNAKPLVAALEACSSHPVAVALSRDLADPDQPARPTLTVEDARQTLGSGIEGRVAGRLVTVGSAAFVRARAATGSPGLDRAERDALDQGLTPIAVAIDGVLVAIAAVGDALRPDARAALDRLTKAGWRPEILSGDHPAIVAAVARRLGIPPDRARGGLSPEDKLALVSDAARAGPVVMVGDGVNDAAALAAADVGIAVHGGAEASLAAADAYLSRPGLSPLADLLKGSARTMRIVRAALTLSTLYNLVAGGLAVAGFVSPLVAAFIMPVSSLTALSLCLKMRSFGGRP